MKWVAQKKKRDGVFIYSEIFSFFFPHKMSVGLGREEEKWLEGCFFFFFLTDFELTRWSNRSKLYVVFETVVLPVCVFFVK